MSKILNSFSDAKVGEEYTYYGCVGSSTVYCADSRDIGHRFDDMRYVLKREGKEDYPLVQGVVEIPHNSKFKVESIEMDSDKNIICTLLVEDITLPWQISRTDKNIIKTIQKNINAIGKSISNSEAAFLISDNMENIKSNEDGVALACLAEKVNCLLSNVVTGRVYLSKYITILYNQLRIQVLLNNIIDSDVVNLQAVVDKKKKAVVFTYRGVNIIQFANKFDKEMKEDED